MHRKDQDTLIEQPVFANHDNILPRQYFKFFKVNYAVGQNLYANMEGFCRVGSSNNYL